MNKLLRCLLFVSSVPAFLVPGIARASCTGVVSGLAKDNVQVTLMVMRSWPIDMIPTGPSTVMYTDMITLTDGVNSFFDWDPAHENNSYGLFSSADKHSLTCSGGSSHLWPFGPDPDAIAITLDGLADELVLDSPSWGGEARFKSPTCEDDFIYGFLDQGTVNAPLFAVVTLLPSVPFM